MAYSRDTITSALGPRPVGSNPFICGFLLFDWRGMLHVLFSDNIANVAQNAIFHQLGSKKVTASTANVLARVGALEDGTRYIYCLAAPVAANSLHLKVELGHVYRNCQQYVFIS